MTTLYSKLMEVRAKQAQHMREAEIMRQAESRPSSAFKKLLTDEQMQAVDSMLFEHQE